MNFKVDFTYATDIIVFFDEDFIYTYPYRISLTEANNLVAYLMKQHKFSNAVVKNRDTQEILFTVEKAEE